LEVRLPGCSSASGNAPNAEYFAGKSIDFRPFFGLIHSLKSKEIKGLTEKKAQSGVLFRTAAVRRDFRNDQTI
jgi:hypothetical protein